MASAPGGVAPDGPGPWIVRAHFDDAALVRQLPESLAPWAVYPEKGYLLLRVDPADWQQLRRLGFRVEIDAQRTSRLGRMHRPLEGQQQGIPGFPCYRTVPETFAAAEALVAAHPGLATWIDIGDSWEKMDDPAQGHDLFVLRLTNDAIPGPKPAFLVFGGVHPREYTPPELLTRFAEHLLERYDVEADASWLLDHHEIHLVLLANPDARVHAETGLSWRKNTDNDHCTGSNLRGVDLNRNFEFQWGCCNGSSSSECSETYRGPSPGSEPETQALQDYMRSIFPDQRVDDLTTPAPDDATGIFIDVHAFGGDVLWSWGFSTAAPPNGDGLWALGRKIAFFNGYRPQQGSLGTVDGATKDFSYGTLGVPGYTLELGTDFFQDCASFEAGILPDNLEMLVHTAKNARTPYQTPFGPDAVDPAVLPLVLAPGDAADLVVTLDDTRYGNSNGTQPSQNIVLAEYNVDVPPWDAGAVGIPMTPADGAFDEQVEAANAAVDTGGLDFGRHTLFTRAQDADGNWGAVSAAFLYVIDPAVAPTIRGFVRDAVSGQPLAATVQVGPFSTETDPGNGSYHLQVPSGQYEVSATADGHASRTVASVVAADLATINQTFWLMPLTEILQDDVEGGNIGWTAESSWAITSEASFSPERSWTDSPLVNYLSAQDTSLVSPLLDLSGLQDVRLSFRHIHELETGFDFGWVQVSTDGGGNWSDVTSFNGFDLDWSRQEVPLPTLDGVAQGRFRFRLTSDFSVTEDGWHIDDIVVAGVTPLSLQVGGACPGILDLNVSAAATSGRVVLLRAGAPGNGTLPARLCGGTPVGLQGPRLFRQLTADAAGDASLSLQVPPTACGMLLQAVDVNTCRVSGVEAIP